MRIKTLAKKFCSGPQSLAYRRHQHNKEAFTKRHKHTVMSLTVSPQK